MQSGPRVPAPRTPATSLVEGRIDTDTNANNPNNAWNVNFNNGNVNNDNKNNPNYVRAVRGGS